MREVFKNGYFPSHLTPSSLLKKLIVATETQRQAESKQERSNSLAFLINFD